MLERGSVEGEVFHRGAVQALTPEEPQLEPHLTALVRRELIRPDVAQLEGEEAFRFGICCSATPPMARFPRRSRAELHERHADWLEQRTERTSRTSSSATTSNRPLATSWSSGKPTPTLAERASERLATAGRVALGRGDEQAAAGLLERALELTRPARLDMVLELELAQAHLSSGTAESGGDSQPLQPNGHGRPATDTGELLARVGAAVYRASFEPDPAVDELEVLAREGAAAARAGRATTPASRRSGARSGTWSRTSAAATRTGRRGEQAIHHAVSPGDALEPPRPGARRSSTGRDPRTRRCARSTRLLPENPHPCALLCRAWLLTMLARFDEAAQVAQRGQRPLSRADRRRPRTTSSSAPIAATAGRPRGRGRAPPPLLRSARGTQPARRPLDLRAAARPFALQARSLRRGRAARPARTRARRRQDTRTQTLWRQVQALVDASRGRDARGRGAGSRGRRDRRAHRRLNHQGDALCDLGEVLRAAGQEDEAEARLRPGARALRAQAEPRRRPRRCATGWPSSAVSPSARPRAPAPARRAPT